MGPRWDVPAAELAAFTTDLAARIAEKPAFSLQLAKQSVNQALDAQGFWTAQQAAFGLQHVGHSHTREVLLRQKLEAARAELKALKGSTSAEG